MNEAVMSMNWAGSIPVVLTLAPSSLSSPTIPPPMHLMVSRMTYLHIGLENAVMRLSKFAPIFSITQTSIGECNPPPDTNENHQTKNINNDTISSTDDSQHQQNQQLPTSSYPICWFQDEETGIPLRWHLFSGVLYDLLQKPKALSKNIYTPPNLPWKIVLHFTSYPSQLLQFSNNTDAPTKTIERFFSNSLKQSLFLQNGSSKVAMSLSKIQHGQLWDSVKRCNFGMYTEVWRDLQREGGGDVRLVPVRVLMDGKPHIQRPCGVYWEKEGDLKSKSTTLGMLLSDWFPSIFPKPPSHNGGDDYNNDDNEYCLVRASSIHWAIHGIQPPLSMKLLDLWRSLSYPDHFLYITISTVVI